VEAKLDIKLCWHLDVAQWIFTGHRAPWAWMQIELGLQPDRLAPTSRGFATLRVTGTSIPTQWLYVNWVRLPSMDHDMAQNVQSEIDAFIAADGVCSPGPQRTDPSGRDAWLSWSGGMVF
jgi:hypothetical protein